MKYRMLHSSLAIQTINYSLIYINLVQMRSHHNLVLLLGTRHVVSAIFNFRCIRLYHVNYITMNASSHKNEVRKNVK